MNKAVLQIVGYIVTIILLLYILVATLIPEQTIRFFGFRTFVVVSTSMEPDINKYDFIVVTKATEDSLEVRDAITFYVHIPELGRKSYVTHYIGAIEEDGMGNTIYKTQGATKDPGDYDDWTDGEGHLIDITIDDIEGEYQFRIPRLGYLIYSLRDPIFVGLLVVNGTIIYFVYRYIKKLLTQPEDNKKEKE